MTDLKDWIEKLRDQKTATCPADYEERCELAHALSALEKERDEALRTIEGLAWLGEKVTACVDPSGVFHVDGMRREVQAYRTRAQAAETELSALKALVGRMVEGLEPFAREADDWPDAARENLANVYIARCDGGTTFETTFSLADLARARSLLSEAKGEGER